jgi:hypothetical protein
MPRGSRARAARAERKFQRSCEIAVHLLVATAQEAAARKVQRAVRRSGMLDRGFVVL